MCFVAGQIDRSLQFRFCKDLFTLGRSASAMFQVLVLNSSCFSFTSVSRDEVLCVCLLNFTGEILI